jgi:recombinational DNA repair ATPase RecF
VVKIGNQIEQEDHTTRKEKMIETIQEKLRTSQEQVEQNRLEVMEELKNQIERLEEAYSHIEDARHEIRHAFTNSNDSDRNMVKQDFDKPLLKILECPQKGLDNFIKILEAELEYIKNHNEKQLEAA